jgi:transcriptional/translational regulatory protein YebC/TACO1
MMTALEAGADDIDSSDEESFTIICQPNNLDAVRKGLTAANYKITRAEITMVPSTYVEVTDKDVAKQLLRLLDVLENHDDVQTVYANFDMNADWLAESIS